MGTKLTKTRRGSSGTAVLISSSKDLFLLEVPSNAVC